MNFFTDNPDKPVSFGYKSVWITVQGTDPKEVANFLKLKNQQRSNWKSGIKKAYEDEVFVSPPIDGYIFIVGVSLPWADTEEKSYTVKELVNKLSLKYGTAYYFATHRVVEFHAWIKSVNGNIVRAYSYLGERGENTIVEGDATDFESELNLINSFSEEFKDDNYFENEELIFPNEEIVMDVAGAWSINPSTLEERNDSQEGIGILGKLQ